MGSTANSIRPANPVSAAIWSILGTSTARCGADTRTISRCSPCSWGRVSRRSASISAAGKRAARAGVSAFAVSLLNMPYEESEHWKREFSPSLGYQKELFEQSYEHFLDSVSRGSEEKLMGFLKSEEDRTPEEVDSALNYLRLRKVKRMLLENQLDLEKEHTPEQFNVLYQTHKYLKDMEIGLAAKMEAVVIR